MGLSQVRFARSGLRLPWRVIRSETRSELKMNNLGDGKRPARLAAYPGWLKEGNEPSVLHTFTRGILYRKSDLMSNEKWRG
jgi:hypothetical protein